jgi:hypothetical protein
MGRVGKKIKTISAHDYSLTYYNYERYDCGMYNDRRGGKRRYPDNDTDERPSDFDGVGYTELDAGGAWKQALGQELQAVGFKIDWNKVMAA